MKMKRKTAKRKMVLILSVVLAFAFLAGCTGDGNPAATKQPSSSGSRNTGTDSTEPLKFSVTTVDFGEEPTGKLIQEEWLKACEKKLGRPLDIDFDYISISDYAEKLKLLLSGGDLSDVTSIFNIENSEVVKYGSQGLLEEISQHADITPNYQEKVNFSPENKKVATAPDGKIYSFYHINVIEKECVYGTGVGGVRYDILKKHGLEIPTTVEELTDTARALKKEYPDIYPIVQIEEWEPFETALFYSNHTMGSTYFNGGKYVYGPLEDGYRDALTVLNQWYKEELVAPDYFAHTQTEGFASVANGTAFLVPKLYESYPLMWSKQYPDQEWVLVDGFRTDGKDIPWNRTNVSKPGFQMENNSGIVVSSDSGAKEDIMNLQYDEDVYNILSWGIEGKTYEVKSDGTKGLLPEFIGGESSDELISLALPASGRSRAGIFPTPQNRNMLWDDFNGPEKIYNGSEVVEMQVSRYSGQYEGATIPSYLAPNNTLSKSEAQDYSNIMTAVDTFAKEAKIQFIKGERSFDDWDKYLEEIHSIGDIEKALDIYNSKLDD